MAGLKLNSLTQTHLTTNTPDTPGSITTGENISTVRSFWKEWRWWLAPALIGLALVLYFVDPFIGDWDGMDYTMFALAVYPSSMTLGRHLFIFLNHALFSIANTFFHVAPENAYLIFKYAVVAQSPLALVACWVLARNISGSLYTATIAALLIACSPVFVLYGGQVMTDVPSVLLLAVGLIIHLQGIRQSKPWMLLLGAGLMGLGVNLRESVGFFAPWLVAAPFVLGWKFRKREVLVVLASGGIFVFLALGWFGYWFITDPHYRWVWHGWRESMRDESSRHPVTIANLRPFILFLFISAPLVFCTIPFAPFYEWRRRRLSPLLLLWLISFFADGLLIFNYSTTVNWRYFLTGLPGIAPLGGHWLLHVAETKLGSAHRAFVACLTAIALLAVIFFIYLRPISYEFIERRAMSKDYKHRLVNVPTDAVMISGSQTIAVNYWAAIGLGQWKTIGTGGGWPGDKLVSVIEDNIAAGRRDFLDSDPHWWLPCGWQREEIQPITELENHFHFRRVTDTIYELRPVTDPTANDQPNLKRLLPENRPENTKKGPPGKT